MPSVKQSELAGRKETDEVIQAIKDCMAQFEAMVDQIHFPVTAIGPAASVLTSEVAVEVADANDVKALFGDNVVRRVQVDLTGTAVGREISADGVTYGSSIVLVFEKGAATVHVRATAAGTAILALTDVDSSGLTLGGNATVTFS